ncbi:MAG: metallophosphoesterase [Bdellovibrionaceae bacterium]|nr:metallophosphoesterase [Pseudobdellovibrionaceae bacterium]
MKKTFLFSSLLLVVACTQAPVKEYNWISLSEKGLMQNSVRVLKESKEFKTDHGFKDLEIKKHSLAPSEKSYNKIVLLGDTGCRLKEGAYGRAYQNCKDPQEWPYANVIEKVAAEKPDLVIHVGDYHYREHCSEGKPCRQMTDTIGYGWNSWQADFFLPSTPAFAAIPWLFVRGNHEDCKRAFEGYKLISEQKWDKDCVAAEKTEYIQLGDVLIVQLDSSSVSDDPSKTDQVSFWEQQFKDIEQNLQNSKAKHIWLFTHKPITGLVDAGDNKVAMTNVHLQKAFAKTNLNKKIELTVAGHIHNTQYLLAKGFPLQLVVGNSGSALDPIEDFKTPEKILKTKFEGVTVIKFSTTSTSDRDFGYAVLFKEPGTNKWMIGFHNMKGERTLTLPAAL